MGFCLIANLREHLRRCLTPCGWVRSSEGALGVVWADLLVVEDSSAQALGVESEQALGVQSEQARAPL